MSVKADLRAARALVETPETWEKRGIVLTLAKATDADNDRYAAVRQALLNEKWTIEAVSYMQHADLMALFDRAIESAS